MLDIDTAIKKNLEQNKAYKYLGNQEADGVRHVANKENVRKEFYRKRTAIVIRSWL